MGNYFTHYMNLIWNTWELGNSIIVKSHLSKTHEEIKRKYRNQIQPSVEFKRTKKY